ncbi:MAG: V-type ATPase subunit [Rhodanobacteraceae bacterium]|nr:V-type ATPase subunit [Rhodanobacteraceae bacterium]
MIHGATDYALTRLRARTGRRLDGEGWRQISSARSLPAVLEQLRAGNAASWVEGIGSASDAHAIEAGLRRRFQAQLEALGRWADPQWQPALSWCARLVQLPALRQVKSTASADLPDWPATDLRHFAGVGGDSALPLEAAWEAELMRRLPVLDADAADELSRLQRTAQQHRLRFSRLAAGNGWPERAAFERQLLSRMRRNPLSPVHLLTAVALSLLDYERVRGELLRWAALPPESHA